MTAQVQGVYREGRVRMRTGEDSGMLEAKLGESEEWKTVCRGSLQPCARLAAVLGAWTGHCVQGGSSEVWSWEC